MPISRRVELALGAWGAMHQNLDVLEATLKSALVKYASGTGPRPDELFQQVVALRRDCEAAVRVLLDAADDASRHKPKG